MSDSKVMKVISPTSTGHSRMEIIATQNNYYGEDPLQHAFMEFSQEHNDEYYNEKYKLLLKLIKKDKLKRVIEDKRIYKAGFYQQLFNTIKDYKESEIAIEDIERRIIDDGYYSILNSIVALVTKFSELDDENNAFRICKNESLYCRLTPTTLQIQLSPDISNRTEYLKAAEDAQVLENELKKLSIINIFYNIYIFNDVQISAMHQSDLPFVNEEIKFQVTPMIIPNLIKPLYRGLPECGAREVIQNGIDACKELIKGTELINYKPKIEIVYNNDEIIFRDFGVGMNDTIIKNHYFHVGNSSKEDSEYIGQFGIGSLATFLLGDEIHVKSRRFNEKIVYEFTYENQSYKGANIDIYKISDTSFDPGTEITIKLSSKLQNENLIKVLKLDQWYLNSEIPIYINEKKIPSLEEFDLKWINTDCKMEGLKLDFLVNNKDWKGNVSLYGRIVYNGMLLSDDYSLGDEYGLSRYGRHARLMLLPCLRINETNKSKEMTVNLERTSFINFDDIRNDLVNSILKEEYKRLATFEKKVLERKNLIVKTSIDGTFYKNFALIYSRYGVFLLNDTSLEFLKSKGINELCTVYSYSNNLRFDDLDDKYAYVFYTDFEGKKFVSDRIENCFYKSLFVPNAHMNKYFFNADSYTNGFRTDVVKKIYQIYNYTNIVNKNSANAFWVEHNNEKYEFKKHIEYYSNNLFYKLYDYCKVNESLIESIVSKEPYCLIEIEKINSSSKGNHEIVIRNAFQNCPKLFELL